LKSSKCSFRANNLNFTNSKENQRVFVDYNNNEDFDNKELPDGMTIDKNGNLWVACFNGSRVVNIDANTGQFKFYKSLIAWL
jgi:sugar lactone lactonase YvrE